MTGSTTPAKPRRNSFVCPIEAGPDKAPTPARESQSQTLPRESAVARNAVANHSVQRPSVSLRNLAELKSRQGEGACNSTSSERISSGQSLSSAPSSNCNSPKLKSKKNKNAGFWGQLLNEIMH